MAGTTTGRGGWEKHNRRERASAAERDYHHGDVYIKMPGAFPYRQMTERTFVCPIDGCGDPIEVGDIAVWWRKPDVMAHEQCARRDWDRRRQVHGSGEAMYDTQTSRERAAERARSRRQCQVGTDAPDEEYEVLRRPDAS